MVFAFSFQGNSPQSRQRCRSPWRRSQRSTRDYPWRTRSCCGSCTTGTCAAPRDLPHPRPSLSSPPGIRVPSPAPASRPDDASGTRQSLQRLWGARLQDWPFRGNKSWTSFLEFPQDNWKAATTVSATYESGALGEDFLTWSKSLLRK